MYLSDEQNIKEQSEGMRCPRGVCYPSEAKLEKVKGFDDRV